MAKRSGKPVHHRITESIPGGLAHRNEIWRSLVTVAGVAMASCVPRGRSDDFFDWLYARWQSKHARHGKSDPIAARIAPLLAGICPDDDISSIVAGYHAWRIEDLWARWQSMRHANWNIDTEVEGLEHIHRAHNEGHGTVLWGSSACGTLFPKIALRHAGVPVTQLSTADHGAWFPLTLWGKWIAGPLYCKPENRYIADRVRIPLDGNNRYLYQLGKVLKDNGNVWIAAERSRPKKHAIGVVLGRSAKLPIGAPVIALRNNAELLPVSTRRTGRLSYRVVIEPPIVLNRAMSRQQIVDAAVQEFARRLDRQIRSSPGDWDWNHLWVRDLLERNDENGQGLK